MGVDVRGRSGRDFKNYGKRKQKQKLAIRARNQGPVYAVIVVWGPPRDNYRSRVSKRLNVIWRQQIIRLIFGTVHI